MLARQAADELWLEEEARESFAGKGVKGKKNNNTTPTTTTNNNKKKKKK